METENARREEQEKEGIEKQGSNEMLNDFLPIIECYLRIETLEKLISKISCSKTIIVDLLVSDPGRESRRYLYLLKIKIEIAKIENKNYSTFVIKIII